MRYEEIINKIREKDEKVTHCFFFWTGPTIKHIEELRRTDPAKASRLPRPVCDTCRPGLLRVLHNLYGSGGFDYTEKVTEFYYHLIKDDKLASISDPDRLMGWIVTTAFNFFRKEKIKNNELLENPSADSLIAKGYDMEEDDMRSKTRDFVTEVLAAMPNRTYARLLDEAALEIAQYKVTCGTLWNPHRTLLCQDFPGKKAIQGHSGEAYWRKIVRKWTKTTLAESRKTC